MKSREPLALLIIIISIFVSAIHPYDGLTWQLEVSPVLIAAPVLAATYSSFPLTPLLYRLIFIHSLILITTGHYTYARVPLGTWAQDIFHLARNDCDRLGNFAQGFVPAMVAREILLRNSPLHSG